MNKPTDEEIEKLANVCADEQWPSRSDVDYNDGCSFGFEIGFKAALESEYVKGLENLSSQCAYCGKPFAHIDCDCQKAMLAMLEPKS